MSETKYAGVNASDIFHPTGILYRNPSHLKEGERYESEDEIVKALEESGEEPAVEIFNYDTDSPSFLPGFKKIRTMEIEEAKGLCKSLLRCRPSLFKVHIVLGDYPSARPILGDVKVRSLSATKPRPLANISDIIAEVLTDKTINCVSLKYTVNLSTNKFVSSAEVYGVQSREEYMDDKCFKPVVVLTYLPNN